MIFVDKENKELLEQHLGDYATWMPYGFGEKGMLGLYPTTEEEIIEQLKKCKIPYYTEVTEAVVLTESGNDEADEAYKGIFIDRKTGDFKILTGRFPDKKAMINKYGSLGKDYIARKVFEKPVFDWILNNAKSSLDSYLMFSTAFSKWRHNSILDKYYIKLINDMPQLFKNVRAQDRIGGDNKAKHADKEAIELDEAEYVGNYDDIVGGKIYLVVYGDGGVLADFTDSAPIKYSANQYDFESVELYQWLQKAVNQVEFDQLLNNVKPNEEGNKNEWKLSTYGDSVVLGSKMAQVYQNNGKILLAHPNDEGKKTIESFNSIPELNSWLQTNNYTPLPAGSGEAVKAIAVKRSKKDPKPQIFTRDQIEHGYTRDVGKVWNDNQAFQKVLDDPSSEKFRALVYCKDDEGRRIIMKPYPSYINHVIEKGNGIDDRQVWITALQTLNTVGKMQPTDEVFIQDPNTGREYFANRRGVETNVHNMEPGQDKKILTKSGREAHTDWAKIKIPDNFKDRMAYYDKRRSTVVRNSVDPSKTTIQDKDYQIGKIRLSGEDKEFNFDKKLNTDTKKQIDPEKFDIWKREWVTKNITNETEYFKEVLRNMNIRLWPKEYHDQIEQDRIGADIYEDSKQEQKEHDMFLRDEVKKLVEASGVFDLPDIDVDLSDDNANNIVRFIVKNTFGKDDVEEVLVNKPISDDVELEDFTLPEVEAAAERIKARNPGKKVYVQVNDEEPTEYIDIEEPQA